MKTLVLASAIVFVSHQAHLQTTQEKREEIRLGKIESILRLQDLRTPFDGRVAALLSDDDPVVRRRAILACGSLQDTSAISLLSRALCDPDSETAVAAAFALGQTGSLLSERGRQSLEYELIRRRLPETRAAGRLVEEIGKFGTASGLHDLIAVAGVPPVRYAENLMMSVARFALRGISSPEGAKFLLRYVQPGVLTPWQAVYALQRIGDNPGTRASIESLRRLERHSDPFVRMNLATFIGKLRDAGGQADLLQRMADMDKDWRVRVNALRALGQFSWRENTGVITTFRRAFSDRNPHIAITALSVFPGIGVDASDTTAGALETMRQLDSMAANTSGGVAWQIQAEAAAALAKIQGRIPRALLSGAEVMRPELKGRLIRAAGESGDPAAQELLCAAVAGNDPVIVSAALEGLRSLALRKPDHRALADSASSAAIHSLGRHDIAIVSAAAGILRDSLFRVSASVLPLLKALGELRPPGDTEAMQDVVRTLGELRDSRAKEPLVDLLRSGDPSVAHAAAVALGQITGTDYTGMIVRDSVPVTTDLDFAFLRSLPPVVRAKLQTSRGDILIELDREGAPFTTMSIVKLSEQRMFYRELTFHRVVPNFVVQGGDPRGDGWGGAGYSLRSEFSLAPFGTGTVGIASAGKDTEGSQFFITHSPQPHLDGRYTVTGNVVEGMDVVDDLQVGDRIYDILILR